MEGKTETREGRASSPGKAVWPRAQVLAEPSPFWLSPLNRGRAPSVKHLNTIWTVKHFSVKLSPDFGNINK